MGSSPGRIALLFAFHFRAIDAFAAPCDRERPDSITLHLYKKMI